MSLQKILDEAPEGATHVEISGDDLDYWCYAEEQERLLWWSRGWEYQKVDSDCLADFHSLDDLRRIAELEKLNLTFAENELKLAELEEKVKWLELVGEFPKHDKEQD